VSVGIFFIIKNARIEANNKNMVFVILTARKVSLGAILAMYKKIINNPPRKIRIKRYPNQKFIKTEEINTATMRV
jgi:hypothetical protein